jgi:uncharacterized lipoprotein NlpE involved in copper resistance
MKKLLVYLCLLFVVIIIGCDNNSQAPSKYSDSNSSSQYTPTEQTPKEVTVYITRTGQKYHRIGCRYLSKSCIPVSLDEAKTRYGACSVCNPPR